MKIKPVKITEKRLQALKSNLKNSVVLTANERHLVLSLIEERFKKPFFEPPLYLYCKKCECWQGKEKEGYCEWETPLAAHLCANL